jgi:hypothetical protein
MRNFGYTPSPLDELPVFQLHQCEYDTAISSLSTALTRPFGSGASEAIGIPLEGLLSRLAFHPCRLNFPTLSLSAGSFYFGLTLATTSPDSVTCITIGMRTGRRCTGGQPGVRHQQLATAAGHKPQT